MAQNGTGTDSSGQGMAHGGTKNKEGVSCNFNETDKPNCENNNEVEVNGGELRMLSRINFQLLEENSKRIYATMLMRRSSNRVRKQVQADPPRIQELVDSQRLMYMHKALNEFILNYDTLSFDGLYQTRLLDQRLNESLDDEAEEFYELFGNSTNFIKYEKAILHLKNNKLSTANRILLGLVNDAVEPAFYAYTLVFFKGLLNQCDVLNPTGENARVMENNKDEIIAAVQLLKRAIVMEPASSFLSGIMKKFDIGRCSQILGGFWEDDLLSVVNFASTYGFLNVDQDILDSINFNNRSHSGICGIAVRRNGKILRQMGNYSLFEIALSMSPEECFNVNTQLQLFRILSDEFPEALYNYGAALLQIKSDRTMLKETVKKAMEYLNRAIGAGHEGAEFLLGVLPFDSAVASSLTQRQIDHCISTLNLYIDCADSSCNMNKNNIDKAAFCLAAEYYSRKSFLVLHDKYKAEEILKSRNMREELHNLQKFLD